MFFFVGNIFLSELVVYWSEGSKGFERSGDGYVELRLGVEFVFGGKDGEDGTVGGGDVGFIFSYCFLCRRGDFF